MQDLWATTRELWAQDGALVCCLVLPPALVLFLVLEVLVRLGLFTRLQVEQLLDRGTENTRRDEEGGRAVDEQLARGCRVHLTAEGGFVLRRGRSAESRAAERKLRELLGE